MPVTNVELLARLCMRVTLGVEISDTDDVLERLRAHSARVHAQSSANRAWNSFHPFQSAKSGVLPGVGNLFQFCPDACGNLVAVDLDFVEISATRMNNYSTNTAVTDEQV